MTIKRASTPGSAPALPDYLRPGLRLVIVGLNPGLYSAQRRHYYARPGNLFWPTLYQAGLIPEPLGPDDDARVLEFGIGLTDLVARATAGAHELSPAEFAAGAPLLERKLAWVRPVWVCFNGLSGYRQAFERRAVPGEQARTLAGARVFLVPSSSRRNAAYSPAAVLAWWRVLAERL